MTRVCICTWPFFLSESVHNQSESLNGKGCMMYSMVREFCASFDPPLPRSHSCAWFSEPAAVTTVRSKILFRMPRPSVNLLFFFLPAAGKEYVHNELCRLPDRLRNPYRYNIVSSLTRICPTPFFHLFLGKKQPLVAKDQGEERRG